MRTCLSSLFDCPVCDVRFWGMAKSRDKLDHPKSINAVVGGRIKKLRVSLGLSQQALAERGDISVDAVGKVERGVYSPSLETLDRIAAGLAVPLADLLKIRASSAPKRSSLKRAEGLLASATPAQLKVVIPVLRSLLKSL